ncbi:hypothetical protein COCCADRAFT_97151 [Bipolaris zeicola 26-R-13]|uniref:Uncharacterized protein n=1 Tax=Cochliobolus carbonum (strain 26-R-13) TaxID=930089 RepID=W6YBW3_COCC2|nr:uncharacterized protein COCCADRAFT_97151 [Bipolaris zeicola 26-R-13]EUC32999.1 hypothetical protein COCCADRAFT_97151 [Bipolaris zeicola 26-R-13]
MPQIVKLLSCRRRSFLERNSQAIVAVEKSRKGSALFVVQCAEPVHVVPGSGYWP